MFGSARLPLPFPYIQLSSLLFGGMLRANGFNTIPLAKLASESPETIGLTL